MYFRKAFSALRSVGPGLCSLRTAVRDVIGTTLYLGVISTCERLYEGVPISLVFCYVILKATVDRLDAPLGFVPGLRIVRRKGEFSNAKQGAYGCKEIAREQYTAIGEEISRKVVSYNLIDEEKVLLCANTASWT